MESILIKRQKQTYKRETFIDGHLALVVVTIRHDDECGNGHNTFAITTDIYEQYRQYHEPTVKLSNGRIAWLNSCGCQHDVVRRVFPELSHLIKWHLTSTDGPLYYHENTMYWVSQGNLDYARSCAVWPDAELSDFTHEALNARFATLMESFRHDITAQGLEY